MRQVSMIVGSNAFRPREPSNALLYELKKTTAHAECFKQLRCLRKAVVLVHQILRTYSFDHGKTFFAHLQSNPSIARHISWSDISAEKDFYQWQNTTQQLLPNLTPCSER